MDHLMGTTGSYRSRVILFVIAVVIGIAGTAFRIVLVEETRLQSDLNADAVDYYMYAYNLSNTGVYSRSDNYYKSRSEVSPDSDRPPLYSLLASLWIEDGDREEIRRVLYLNLWLQCVSLLVFSIVLIHMWNSYWSIIPLVVVWFNPHIANIVVYFLTESLFMATLLMALYFLWDYERRRSGVCLVLFGLCIGLAAITRGTMAYFLIFLFAIYLVSGQRNMKNLVLILVPGLLPVLVWGLRNLLVVTDDMNIRMISTLYHGSFPEFMYQGRPESFPYPHREDPMQEFAMASVSNTLSLIWQRFVEDPVTYLRWYAMGKLSYFWQWSIVQGQGQMIIYPTVASPYYSRDLYDWTYEFNLRIHPFLVTTGLAGSLFVLVRIVKKSLPVLSVYGFCALIVLYASLLHIVALSIPRYSIPFKPFLVVMSCYFVIIVYQSVFTLRDRK